MNASFREPRVLIPFVLATLIWSSTWIVIKDQMAGGVPPLWSVAYRYAIALVAVFVYVRATGARLGIGRAGHAIAAAFGIPLFCFNYNLVYQAEIYVTSGIVAVAFALLMVPNSALAWIFLKQRSTAGFLAGSAIACVGVALLFVQELRSGAGEPGYLSFGIGLTLLAVFSASIANIIQSNRVATSWPMPTMLFWGIFYGLIADVAAAWWLAGPPVIEARLAYWAGLLWLGLFGSALAFALYFAVMRRVGAARAAYSGLLVPILAMAISTVLEGYRWSMLAAAGALIALAGMAIALRAKRQGSDINDGPAATSTPAVGT